MNNEIRISDDTRAYLGAGLIDFIEGIAADYKPSVILSSLDFDQAPEDEARDDQQQRRQMLRDIGADDDLIQKIEADHSETPNGFAYPDHADLRYPFYPGEDALYFHAMTSQEELNARGYFSEGRFDFSSINPKDASVFTLFHEFAHLHPTQSGKSFQANELDAELKAKEFYTQAYEAGLVTTAPDDMFAYKDNKRLFMGFSLLLTRDSIPNFSMVSETEIPQHFLTIFASHDKGGSNLDYEMLHEEVKSARAVLVDAFIEEQGLQFSDSEKTLFILGRLHRFNLTEDDIKTIESQLDWQSGVPSPDDFIAILPPQQQQEAQRFISEGIFESALNQLKRDKNVGFNLMKQLYEDGAFEQHVNFEDAASRFFEAVALYAPDQWPADSSGSPAINTDVTPSIPVKP